MSEPKTLKRFLEEHNIGDDTDIVFPPEPEMTEEEWNEMAKWLEQASEGRKPSEPAMTVVRR